jgi:hypothetical protein
MNTVRESNFKIGCFHGKLDPKNGSEAKIRNDIYLTGMVEIRQTNKTSILIRLVAFEMPLTKIHKRNKCIDLLGYDKNFKPYIVELKKPKSPESVDKIIRQIDGYAERFDECCHYVEKEIRKRYLWNDFKFSTERVGKIFLASRQFFEDKHFESFEKIGIFACSFSKIKENFDNLDILSKCGSKGVVGLKIHNK